MKLLRYPTPEIMTAALQRPATGAAQIEGRIKEILSAVSERGDDALREFTLRFDGVQLLDFRVSPEILQQQARQVSPELRKALEIARANIERFHRSQLPREQAVETMPGVRCWRRSIALDRVGIYIPAGTAPLFSSALMLAIPARLAGCKDIVLCTPPDKSGAIHPAIALIAEQLQIEEVYAVGGAQAIAAMAYGTQSIAKVQKICGPGNAYVTGAKEIVARQGTAIDMPAGPSEVLVLADHSANPAFVAADLLAQAEHGPDSQVLLLTTDELLFEAVQRELAAQLELLPRKEIAAQALENSVLCLLPSIEKAMQFSNVYAPEHLIIASNQARELAEQVKCAGSVFLGNCSPEAAGDYASGTNHTLPTAGWARSVSGVSVDTFVKKVTFQEISASGLQQIGATVMTMAKHEGLEAHSRAVSIRLASANLSQQEIP